MLDPKKVQKLAKAQGFASVYQLWLAIGAAGYKTSQSQIYRLWDENGEPDPRQSTMDMLCRVLKCEQADLLKRGRK